MAELKKNLKTTEVGITPKSNVSKTNGAGNWAKAMGQI